MSVPNEPDYIQIQVKVGTAYVLLCGIETATVNKGIQSTDRYRRDCEKPAAIPTRAVRVTGTQWDVSGTGVVNMDQFDLFENLIGAHAQYRLLYGRYDDALTNGERTGTVYGYRDGAGVLASHNENLGDEGTAEIAITGEGVLSWTQGVPGAGA